MSFPTCPNKEKVFFLCTSFINSRMYVNVHTQSQCHSSTPDNPRRRGRGRETPPPHGLAGRRRVTFQTSPYPVFWQCRLIRHIENINDITLFLHSLNIDFRIEIPVAWITTIRHRQQSCLLVSLRTESMLENPPTINKARNANHQQLRSNYQSTHTRHNRLTYEDQKHVVVNE